MLSKSKYAKNKTWKEMYPEEVNLRHQHSISWKPIFDKIYNDPRFSKIEKCLQEHLEIPDRPQICPKPEFVYTSFKLTPFNKIKVVFIGQDPYFDHEEYEDIFVPQAMGLSFSVPCEFEIPSSLKNIYGNLQKNEHFLEYPDHGNLTSWAAQGCLMLNSALTVIDGKYNKNCHQNLWIQGSTSCTTLLGTFKSRRS